MSCASYLSTDPSAFHFILKTHLFPIALHLSGKSSPYLICLHGLHLIFHGVHPFPCIKIGESLGDGSRFWTVMWCHHARFLLKISKRRWEIVLCLLRCSVWDSCDDGTTSSKGMQLSLLPGGVGLECSCSTEQLSAFSSSSYKSKSQLTIPLLGNSSSRKFGSPDSISVILPISCSLRNTCSFEWLD